ncbi:hypothetical protein Vi05172_g2192 [Venturia inaequalis]|nr:hypothetical protein Vi05172_g2192 [Venturia inaequalis]
MSSGPSFELRGMETFGFLDFNAEQQRREKIQTKFEAGFGGPLVSVVSPTGTAVDEKFQLVQKKIGPCSTPEEFELSVQYLTVLGARRIRELMYMAGMEAVYKTVASSDHHDKVRLLAVELVNKVENANSSGWQQPVAVGPLDLAVDDICSRVAKMEHKAPGFHPNLYDKNGPIHMPIGPSAVLVSRFPSNEEWGPPVPSNLPSWKSMRDEISNNSADPNAASKFAIISKSSDKASTNASTAVPQAALVFQGDDSMEIDTIPLSNTALASSSEKDSMEADPRSSSNTAPASYQVEDRMDIDPIPTSKAKTAQFGFAGTATGLFSNVDTTAMDGNSSDNVVPVNMTPVSSNSSSTSSPNSSGLSIWDSIKAYIKDAPKFITASSRPISLSTPCSSPPSSVSNTPITPKTACSSPVASAKPKPAFALFGFSNTAARLFSDVDTSTMDGSSFNVPISSPGISDDEDSVMSDAEDTESIDAPFPADEMEICSEDHEGTHTGSTTSTSLSQQEIPKDLGAIGDMRVPRTSLGKRKSTVSSSDSIKRARTSLTTFRLVKPLRSRTASIDAEIKLVSTPATPIVPKTPKPTAFIRSSQSKQVKARQLAERIARYMNRLCRAPANSSVSRRCCAPWMIGHG